MDRAPTHRVDTIFKLFFDISHKTHVNKSIWHAWFRINKNIWASSNISRDIAISNIVWSSVLVLNSIIQNDFISRNIRACSIVLMDSDSAMLYWPRWKCFRLLVLLIKAQMQHIAILKASMHHCIIQRRFEMAISPEILALAQIF